MKFAEAQARMIKYLDSDDFTSREDAESTLGSIKFLQNIIKKGFLTDGSQEGLILKGYNPDTKRYYHIEERAYITGFMKPAQGHTFIDWINSHTDKVAFMAREDPSKEFETLFYEGDVKGIPDIPVTVGGSTPTKGGHIELYPNTKLLTVFPSSIIAFEKKQAHLNKVEPAIYVMCFDPKYGRKATSKQGLYADVLKGLEAK